jgi:hypothetical protein
VPLGSLADQGGYDLYLADSLVFISGYYTGSGYEFKILSVGDSAHPRLIGQASTLGDNNGVWANVAENLAFVADRTEGLQVFDISTLSNPRRDTTLLAAGPSLDIAVHGDLAAVANQPAGMKLLSVANPVNPFELGSMDSTYDWPDCDAVELTDSFAFMGWQPNPYLRTILVTDPTHPEKVGACDGMQNDAQDMVLRDSLLYTVSLGRLYVVNVARPREPVLLGTCVCGGGGAVVLQDSFAYTAAGVQQVVNVARPDSPFVVSTISGHGATGLAVRDTFLYVPYVYDTLLTYSVATPSQPRLLSAVQTGVWPWDVVLGEMKAYVALSDGLGVEVFDLSDPTYPTSRGTTSAPYDVRRLRYSNGLLYAALWEAGVAIYETTAIGITERDCRSRLTGKGVSVSPDPASDFVRVAARGGSRRGIRVMDVAGRDVSVRVRPLTLGAADGVALDVSRLRCGIYFVRWDESGTSRPAKFVKQ